ncbi:hypothetical protein [Arenimonas fontis]|uniref:WxL domain-containing protein n=1 Tax=Arenimonas fontis TaxID=2608255 RepID=A0A5B2ZF99_9GAMM|nr:hypothetical protein [Arenimonas fontis]KAA2285771.1 hypothetical protein F0415_03870 [Arenimonas fontis]
MNTVRSIRGLALMGVAALGLIAMTPAFAESDFQTGNGAFSANADLNFRVVIPRFISFRVGSTGSTVDLVQFDVPAANVGDGSPINRSNAGGAPIPVSLLSNVGNVNLSATGSGSGLTDGTNTIPWSEILGTSSDNANFPVPAVGAAATTLNAPASGVINRTADWTFQYANNTVVGAGQYDGTVTYTAAAP